MKAAADDAGILVTWRESPLAAKALFAGIFVNRLGAFIPVFLVLFLTTHGFTAVQAGAALAMYTAGAVLGVLVGGTLTDRLGPRTTILASMVGGAAGVVSILYLRSLVVLLPMVLVVGLIYGCYRPAASTLLAALTPTHRRVMVFAMYRLAYNLGNTAAPIFGALLITVSYDLLFWGEATAALGYAAIAAFALPRRAQAPTTTTGPAGDEGGDRRAAGYLAVLADRRYTLFLLAILINAVVYVQYLSTLPVAMREAGLSTAWYSAMVAMNGIIVITCELLATKVVQRWPLRVIVLVGFLLLGAGQAMYSLPLGLTVFIAGTLTWSIAEIVAGPTIFAYPTMAGPERLRGRYIGASTATFGTGSATGAVIGLTLWELYGDGVWLICAAATVVGMAAAWFGMQPREQPADPPATPEPAQEPPAETTTADGRTRQA